jgi:isoleucyl-tRNA synthetase
MATYGDFGATEPALLDKWARIRAVRDLANKEIEAVRATGAVGSSLQAKVRITAPAAEHAVLASLGEDLKFVFITSVAELAAGDVLKVEVSPSTATKCERCWHWRDDVGHDPAHPGLCGRCTSNLHGAGEPRTVA